MSVIKGVPFLHVSLKYESLLLAQDNKDALMLFRGQGQRQKCNRFIMIVLSRKNRSKKPTLFGEIQ